jgi:parvulin-like peptidyl-prolyl isomerase
MLRFMRKYATGYMIKIMFGLIIVVFIFWGVGSFRGADKVVGEVGSYEITVTEYQETYRKLLDFYRQLYKDRFDENVLKELKLRERTMDQLVDKYLLLIAAKELDVMVTDQEFSDQLASVEAFRRDGKFSKAQYIEVLKRTGLDPKKFEESERTAMLAGKVSSIIKDCGVRVSEADAWDAYVKEKGQVNLGFEVIDPALYRGKVNVTEKELNDLYEKEKGNFRTENTYRLKLLAIDAKPGIKDDVVYTELLKENDIDAYARSKGFAVNDLGTMKESEVLKRLKNLKVEEWLKGLRKGDISLPIRAEGKSFIAKLVDMEPGKPMEKEAIMKELRERLLAEKAKTFAKATAEDAIAKKSVQPKGETGFVSRNTTDLPKIGAIPPEHTAVLALSQNRSLYEKPIEISGKYYLFTYKGEKQPDKAEWEKSKEGYKMIQVVKGREEFYKGFMEEFKKKQKVKIDWKDL